MLGGKRAAVTVTHTRLDPIEQTAIDFAAQLGVDQFNGQIVAGVVQGGQQAAQSADKLFAAANAKVDEVNSAIAAGDQAKDGLDARRARPHHRPTGGVRQRFARP